MRSSRQVSQQVKGQISNLRKTESVLQFQIKIFLRIVSRSKKYYSYRPMDKGLQLFTFSLFIDGFYYGKRVKLFRLGLLTGLKLFIGTSIG